MPISPGNSAFSQSWIEVMTAGAYDSDMAEPLLPAPPAPRMRLLRPEDAPALHALRRLAIGECAACFGTPPHIEAGRQVGYYRRQLTEGRLSGRQAVLGAWTDEQLVAMAGIRRRHPADGPLGLITSMYVTPAFRRLGVGRALLQEARERIRGLWGLTRCQMNVEVNNQAALELYQKQGFRILSREPRAFVIEGTPHDVFLLEVDA